MRVEVYEGSSHLWSLQVKARNGHVVLVGVSPYDTRKAAEEAAGRVMKAMADGDHDLVVIPLMPEPTGEEGS